MSTVMSRSGAKFWLGVDLKKEVAYLYKTYSHSEWEEVTYKHLLEKKINNQLLELERKRIAPVTKPCFIWVFYNNSWIMGGWYIYIKTLKEDYALNFRNHQSDIICKAMNMFPCGVLPLEENFEAWCENFAKQFNRTGFNRKRKQGIATCFCKIENQRIVDISKTVINND